MQPARLRLGQLLVDAQILTEAQLDQVLAAQKSDGRKLGTLLVESGLVSETQLTQILSQQLSVPWVSLYHIDFSRELLNLVPPEVAEKYCLVPIYVRAVRGQGDTLYVAMEDPMNEDALKACSEYSGLPVRAMIAAPTDIRKAVQTYYGRAPAAAPAAPAGTRAAPVAGAGSAQVGPPAAPLSPPKPAPLSAVGSSPWAVSASAATTAAVAAEPENKPAPAVEDGGAAPEGDGAAPTEELHDRPTPVVAYAVASDNGLVTSGPVVAPFMVDEPSSMQNSLASIPEKEPPATKDDSPTLEVREVDISKRKRKQVQLTLLDGTTIKLPSSQKKRGAVPTRNDPPSSEDGLTAADLLAALRAAAHGADAAEILGDNLRWEKMFAAILSLLLRKHLILEKELIDELKKI
jgi:type IV pilus assembly protein PilB